MPLPVEKPQSQEGCVRSGWSLVSFYDAVFAFEGRGHLLDPASVFLGGDLQEKLQIEFAQVRAEGKAVAIGHVAQHRSRDDLIGHLTSLIKVRAISFLVAKPSIGRAPRPSPTALGVID